MISQFFIFLNFFTQILSVKRQSGFLMPSFSSSASIGSAFNIPYFFAISESKDLTLQPRFYSHNKLLLQSEYRQVNANSNHLLILALLMEKILPIKVIFL